MRNKFVYSCNVKIRSLGFNKLSGKHFLPSAGYGSIFPAKSCRDAWKSGSRLVRGQVNMADEAKLCSPVHSIFEVLVVWPVLGRCHGAWFLSVDQCQLQALEFSVHLMDLLSILLRCNCFTRIQKAVVDQTGSRLLDSDYDLFLVKVCFWEVRWGFF